MPANYYNPVTWIRQMPEGLFYQEYLPHSHFRNHVQCYWVLQSKLSEPIAYTVIPDGCMDFVFDVNEFAASGHVVGMMQSLTPYGQLPTSAELGFVSYQGLLARF